MGNVKESQDTNKWVMTKKHKICEDLLIKFRRIKNEMENNSNYFYYFVYS